MKTHSHWIAVACAGFFSSCAAATPPSELVSAREAYRRASTGPAATVSPTEVHAANQALAKAEQSFQDEADSYQTKDLAYVAQRKSEIAEATASIAIDQKKQARAKTDYDAAQGKMLTQTKQDLGQTRSALAASERMTAEQQAAKQAALAKLAAVKEEPRGMVITLSGSVLFASNQATLLPEARSRLDQVADVLLETRERNLIVEGYSDSQGSDSHNRDLSQRRADAVRNYLVKRDYQADRIEAHGLGEASPVADNATAEGRANNRRVEIIIERERQSHSSNP